MKKLLILSAAVLALSAGPALAAQKDRPQRSRMFQKLDSNTDGVITKEEFLSAHEAVFEKMDVNDDGEVTQKEVTAKKKEWREKMKERQEQRMKQRQSEAQE